MERLLRWSALSGALAVILVVAAVALSYPIDGSETRASDAAVSAALAEHQGSATMGARLMMVAAFFWVVFAAQLHSRLRDSDSSWPPTIVAISGSVAAGLMLLDASVTFAMTESAAFADNTQIAGAFIAWQWNSAAMYTPPLIAMLVGTLAVELGHRSFPWWFRWATSALLTMTLLLSVSGLPGLAIAPSLLWVVIASVLLVAKRRRAPAVQRLTSAA